VLRSALIHQPAKLVSPEVSAKAGQGPPPSEPSSTILRLGSRHLTSVPAAFLLATVLLPRAHSFSLQAPHIRMEGSGPPEQSCVAVPGGGIPPISPEDTTALSKHGIQLAALPKMGAEVRGLNLRNVDKNHPAVPTLQSVMAARGFLVFRGQGVLSGDEQVTASELFGGQEIHSTHGVHPQAPNKHIFRLSNSKSDGILGVGPQWHNDGSFERAVFSHVGYHIIKVPVNGGATSFSHLGAAFDALTADEQDAWSRRVSINSNSGIVHPMVHVHPISGRRSVYLHLGMTGAVLEMSKGIEEVQSLEHLRLLEQDEMTDLFNRYNKLLEDTAYRVDYQYEEGDCIFIDNLAIAHRASPEAHQSVEKQGLRILHRTTVAGMINFDPPDKFHLPPAINIYGPNPFGKGVFIGGGLGFRWDASIHMQN